MAGDIASQLTLTTPQANDWLIVQRGSTNGKFDLNDLALKITATPAGGTTGQVLKKNSNTDFDYSWQDDGGGMTPAASGITFTPVGNLAATTVQAALAELDNEKLDKTGGTLTQGLEIQGNLTMDSTATERRLMFTVGGSQRYLYSNLSGDIGLRDGAAAKIAWSYSASTQILNLAADSQIGGAQIESTANKGQANGYASLDSSGKLPEAQLPMVSSSKISGTAPKLEIAQTGYETYPGGPVVDRYWKLDVTSGNFFIRVDLDGNGTYETPPAMFLNQTGNIAKVWNNDIWHSANLPMSLTGAASGDVVVYNGTSWVPGVVTGVIPSWTQIGTTITVGAPTAEVVISGIPSSYNEMILICEDMQHDGGGGANSAMNMFVSTDSGSTYNYSGFSIAPISTPSTTKYRSLIRFLSKSDVPSANYLMFQTHTGPSQVGGAPAAMYLPPYFMPTLSGGAIYLTSAMTNIKFALSVGYSYVSGTFKLYGR